MTNVVTYERECWHCAGRIGLSVVCLKCEAPQPLQPGQDLFGVLDLPRRLVIDAEDLERRWHTASRVVHPDRHQTQGARQQALSLAASAAINRAYRTLRDPVSRGRYWLDMHGAPLGEANNQVPPALAALVFETQELLEELRAGAGVRAAVEARRDEVAGREEALVRELLERYRTWDAEGTASTPDVLADLKRRLSEIAYLNTLHDDLAAALDG